MKGKQDFSAADSAGGPPALTPQIAAEAAVWIARLHGPDRSPRMEREFLEWQARSDAHRVAFASCTDTWQDVARLTIANAYEAGAQKMPGAGGRRASAPARGLRWASALASFALAALGAAFILVARDFGNFSTGVGEQRVVVLEDGTRMSLNTRSRTHVEMNPLQRSVNVEEGEALFEVAKDERRPFVVRAAGTEVVAVGTVFSVKLIGSSAHSSQALAITLIEGHVNVRPAFGTLAEGLTPEKALSLQPGDRLRLLWRPGQSGDSATEVDRPHIDAVVAWKRNEAIFDSVPLSDAVAEMNRYDRTPIVLSKDASLEDLRVSGVYKTGDTPSFARALAALHGLLVREHDGRLELTRTQ